jgi:hypothetical protein
MDIGFSPYCVTFPVVWPLSPMALDAKAACSSSNIVQSWAEVPIAIAS